MIKERYLITGGSGFIGTNLINSMIDDNSIELLSIDISEPKIETHKKRWKQISLTDLNNLEEVIGKFSPTIVIHLGARTDLDGKTLNDYNANIEGVRNLLKILNKVQGLKRAIFASSMYVCKPGYIPKDFEDYCPHTIYGESKVLTEKIIRNHNPQYVWSIIRPTSIWGPYFGEPYNLFFKIVLSRKYFHMGNRACSKTYGYIDNTIYQIQSILESDEQKINKKIFYLGDYTPYNITEWSNEIALEAGFKIPEIPYFIFRCGGWVGDLLKNTGVTFPMTSFRLRNMTTDNIINLDLIKEIAPHLPVSRKEGVRRTIEWIKNN
ncbi:MAG: NAD(P)-dependent oxidoreductase [Tannerellaceae bacterium]|jgi:nucleoside-diphosphate-sugar epimerase|nr:NAD(P)-dependent oxidoreductase [Tannerellaceae bacterium]